MASSLNPRDGTPPVNCFKNRLAAGILLALLGAIAATRPLWRASLTNGDVTQRPTITRTESGAVTKSQLAAE